MWRRKVRISSNFFTSLRKDFQEITLDAANEMRAVGLYLGELKEAVPHGAWVGMFSGTKGGKVHPDALFSFAYETARIYMRFAKAKPEPLTMEVVSGCNFPKYELDRTSCSGEKYNWMYFWPWLGNLHRKAVFETAASTSHGKDKCRSSSTFRLLNLCTNLYHTKRQNTGQNSKGENLPSEFFFSVTSSFSAS